MFLSLTIKLIEEKFSLKNFPRKVKELIEREND